MSRMGSEYLDPDPSGLWLGADVLVRGEPEEEDEEEEEEEEQDEDHEEGDDEGYSE